jgi:hypothetical protein
MRSGRYPPVHAAQTYQGTEKEENKSRMKVGTQWQAGRGLDYSGLSSSTMLGVPFDLPAKHT